MKKRILEVIVICLFCILETWAAYFFAQTQDPVKTRFGQEVQETAKESARTESDSEELEESFPVLVWSESVSCGESSYQMRFDRISPLYDTAPDTADAPSYHADYRLSLLDADGAVVSEQIVADFPVYMEEVYWIQDFSRDGFADIAFCTTYKRSNMMNTFYIWNMERSRYEASSLPLEDDASMEVGPLWNEELSCVITFHGWDWDTAQPVLEMYSFVDGGWQIVRRLEAIGIEGQYHGDYILDYSGERRELLYENGEVIGETIVESNYDVGTIWYQSDSVWSCYYEGNLCLYPDERYWERSETSVGGVFVKKYVSRTEPYRRERGDWRDMLDDRRLPYADEETFQFLKDAYADIDFSGEYEIGDIDTYPLYLEAFYKLIQGDALLTDRETGGTMLLSEFRFFEDFFLSEEVEDGAWSKKDNYTFHFFDMDGDGAPELTVYQYAEGYVVLDYDAGTDTFTVWCDAESCHDWVIGSRKLLWSWYGQYMEFYLLDENGEKECSTFCGDVYHDGEEANFHVMVPEYVKGDERISVPEEMQAQGMYSKVDGQWYFRLTGEQYLEITRACRDAYYELVHGRKDLETYTYEELFGALEDEADVDRGQSNESTGNEVQAGDGSEPLYFDAGSRSGAHFAAYRVPYDEVRADREYKDGDYIAIEDLDSGAIFYVPDEYGELVDIQVTETCVCIRDRDSETGILREHRIPEYFLFSKESVLNVHTRILDTILAGTERAEDLPQKVWQEVFVYDGELFEVLFDRVSPIYHEGFVESSYGYMADYCLTVRDQAGTVISKQRILGLPVYFEQVHWMIDFSGDGFPDIALCSDLMHGTQFGYAHTHFLIWDVQKGGYEERPLPIESAYIYYSGFVHWVPELNAVWRDIGTDVYDGRIDGMFSYIDGEWQLIRKLEDIYSETETYEDPRENIEYPCVEAYRELYYQDGKVVREERVEERWDGEQGKLYPAYWGWISAEVEIGGVTLSRYYVRNEE